MAEGIMEEISKVESLKDRKTISEWEAVEEEMQDNTNVAKNTYGTELI